MVINVADILAFPDETMPKIQAVNTSKLRCSVTRNQIERVMKEHPDCNRKKNRSFAGCQ